MEMDHQVCEPVTPKAAHAFIYGRSLTASEERELHRVYLFLSEFNIRKKTQESGLRLNNRTVLLSDKNRDEEGTLSPSISHIRDDNMNESLNKVISLMDLYEALKSLGLKYSKQQIHEMIWEVDDNMDGHVNWGEFKLMFQRNLSDKVGIEPSQLFHIVQFLCYDQDNSGYVSGKRKKKKSLINNVI